MTGNRFALPLKGLFGILLFCAGLAAQNQLFTISVNAPLVPVNVEVSDSSGRPVTHLRQDDFLVFEDGKPQSIQTFGAADSPYSLILIFDCSDSTNREWPLLNDAVAQFSRYQRPSDRVMTAAFGEQMQVIRNWNEKRDRKLARDMGVCSGTRFYDALAWAIDRLRGVKTRRGVVMLTDAEDNSIPRRPAFVAGRRVDQYIDFTSDRTFQNAARAVEKSGISFYFVAVKTDRNPGFEIPPNMADIVIPDLRQLRLRMEHLAAVSGGSVIYPTRPEEVIPMYERLAQQLGSTYSLGYAPSDRSLDGKNHKIEVRVRHSGLKLRQSRETYLAK